ncbi:MAG: hypothetical protein EZS28_028394 [Streblomastix strix]|uniref:Uncharacterized protein n=1 Tax=Streblomastix strix TaxID=222440 RepID=A0A5J4V140_9EUKA|nr:MAG: hypothetical protein EZS28_028394 [Streblomastix strix]
MRLVYFEIGTQFKQKTHFKYDQYYVTNFKLYFAYAIEKLDYFFGRVTSSIFMIRGGVKFVEDQNESSYPIIDVDAGHCLADVQLAEYEDPFTFTLSTWFEERSCKHIFNCCRWRKKYSMDNEFEAVISKNTQIKEHSLLGHKLGVGQLIVVVKKMDDNSVIFSEAGYNEIVGEMRSYVKKIGYKPDKIQMIPNQRILL